MKNIFVFSLSIILFVHFKLYAQNCSSSGNVMVFANYDGGILNINVDVNIPNLKIGVCTYEPVIINLTGPFASNVSEVIRAGYPNTNNNNCGSVTASAINGPRPANYSIIDIPPVTLTNPNGYNSGIICAYNCNTTTPGGGCNTIDQVADYFSTQFGGSLYSLVAQYCCWQNSSSYNVSSLSGICCGGSPSASISYAGSPYCNSLITAQPVTFSGSTGGTYSATPSGLAIDATTGDIIPGASLDGTYTISYSIPGCPTFTTTAQVTINNCQPNLCNISKLRVGTGFYGFAAGSNCEVDVTFDQPFTNVSQISSCTGICTCSGIGTNFYMETSGGSCLGTNLIVREFEFTTLPTNITVNIRGVGVHNYYPIIQWVDNNGNAINNIQTSNCITGNNNLIYNSWDTTYTCQLNNPCVCSDPTATTTQPTCNTPTGTITVNTPAPATGITYTLEGISPAVAPLTNSTGVFSNLAGGSYSLIVADASNQTCATPVIFNIIGVSAVQTSINESICEGSSYLFNGQALGSAGSFYNTLTAASGCDSIITLNLSVIPTVLTNLNETVCFGESYVFNGQTLTVSDTYYDTLQSATQCDSVVILNLTVLSNLISIIDTTICNGVSLKVGNSIYFQGGTYNIPLQSQAGCDSSILLKLGVNIIDTIVNVSGNILSASQSGASYQWINCSNNISINNADQQTFTASVDGIYAVIVSDGNCRDTSACLEVLISGIVEKPTSQFKIYPNPTSEGLTISGVIESTDVNIYNIQGKLIWSVQNQQTDLLLNTKEISLSNSMYIIEIISGQNKEYHKLFVR